ncbi:DNA translocase FtsK [Bartonella sp. CB189]|uniref:DNA translocase FtsK n=1 Tax=Bartonella sp. CB189 TaxID=3112254 RepID=UPI002F9624E9
MHNSKTKSISMSSISDENAEIVSGKNSSVEIAKIFTYPEVWKKAFAFGQNVRFTRTPEVEILRRRIETDPIFAEQFKISAEKKQKKLTEIPCHSKKTVNPQLTESGVDSLSLKDKKLFCDLTVLGQSSQQNLDIQIEENAEKYKLRVENTNTVSSKKLTFYLSDNVFFECEPFILEQVDTKIFKKDTTSVERKDDDVIHGTVSAFDESITAFYRVLEYRFPKLYDSIKSESSTEDIQGIRETPNLRCANSETNTVEKTQIFNSDPALEKTTNARNDVKATTITKKLNSVTDRTEEDIEKGPESFSIPGEKRKILSTSSALLRNPNSNFMPNCQPVDCTNYKLPSINLLQDPIFHDGTIITQEALERSAGLLESVLEDFGIKGEIIHVHPGPVVTMYEFEPAAGVKSSRVIGLSDDIARSMSAISTRVAVIPGRNVIGIELPNAVRETVYLRELIQSNSFRESQFKLALALGKGINGKPVIAELAKMPHLLVAGTTGSGKSVAINTMILSILYRMTPKQCRFIMVDPKMLELSVYDGIPHLLTPVVTDPKKAVTALKWAVREMEDRYRKMAKLGVRNIDSFNVRVALAAQKGETIMCTVQSGFDKESGKMLYHEEAMDLTQLPYIIVIVDEMADLMMVAGKEIENAIQRLAQMARAAGIHLIMATQRPSVDVITGTIKANFPTRISFQVTSKIDSRTILGEQGAETLLGQGDMLHMAGGGRIVRVHGPFVSDEEVESIVAHLKVQGKPDYLAKVTDSEEDAEDTDCSDSIEKVAAAENIGDDGDKLYLQAVKIVMRDKKCSTSYIQRRLSIGYNKAASIVERMEEKGIVGAANHVGKREILINEYNGKQDSFTDS